MEHLTEIILGFLTTLSTTVAAYFIYKDNKYKNNNSAVNNLIQNLQQEISRISTENSSLRDEQNKYRDKIVDLEKEVILNKHRMVLFESSYNDRPYAEYLTDLNGLILSVNTVFESLFLLPTGKMALELIGEPIEKIWNMGVSLQYSSPSEDPSVNPLGYQFSIGTLTSIEGKYLGEWFRVTYVRRIGAHTLGIGVQLYPVKDVVNTVNQYPNGR